MRFWISILIFNIFSTLPALNSFGDLNHKILFIGDSHTTGIPTRVKNDGTTIQTSDPGLRLNELIREAYPQANVRTYGAGSATANYYLRGTKTIYGYFEQIGLKAPLSVGTHFTPVASKILAEFKPNFTIVFLGTNYLRETDDKVIQDQTSRLAAQIRNAGSTCIWLGMIDIRGGKSDEASINATREKINHISGVIEGAVQKYCTYKNTIPFVDYPNEPPAGSVNYDGIHYNRLGGKGRELSQTWATKAMTVISSVIPK